MNDVEGTRALPPAGRRWRRALAIAGVTSAALVAVPAWLLATGSGLNAVAALANRAASGMLELDGVRGRLIGPLEVDRLRLHTAELELNLDALRLEWSPRALFDGRVDIERLQLGAIEVLTRAGEASAPPAVPESLRLPVELRLADGQIGRLSVARAAEGEDAPAPVFSAAKLAFALDSDSAQHHLQRFDAALDFGSLSLTGTIASTAPFALDLNAVLAGRVDPAILPEGSMLPAGTDDYRLEATAKGALAAPVLSLSANSAGLSGEGRVELRPFDELPLHRLVLGVGQLDPSRFMAGAPKALLRIDANLQASAEDGLTLGGPLSVRNARAETVDAGGLPFEQLDGRLTWSQQGAGVEGLVLALSGGGRVAGVLNWTAPAKSGAPAGPAADGWGTLDMRLELARIDTARLDRRLPRQTLHGKVEARADALRQTAEVSLAAGEASLTARGEIAVGTTSGAGRDFKLKAAVRRLDPGRFHPAAPRARISLDLDAQGALAAEPDLTVDFRLAESMLEGQKLSGNGHFRVRGQTASDVRLALDLGGNTLEANGAWGRAGDRLRYAVDAPALALIGHGLGGRLGMEGELSGGLAAPAGEVRFFGEQLTLPGDVRIAALNGQGSLAEGLEGPFNLSLGVSGVGRTGAAASADWLSTASLSAQGSRGRHRIALSANTEADTLEVMLEGGLKAAAKGAPRWEGQLLGLESRGRFAARLQAPASLVLAADGVGLGKAVFAAGEEGRIALDETRWSPTGGVFRGAMSGLSFGLVSRPDGRPRRGPGPLQLGAEWDLRLGNVLEGEARVFRERGDLVVSGDIGTRLGLERFEARLVARGTRLALSVGAQGTELGELSGSLTALAERTQDGWQLARQAPLLGSARLRMPSIAWLGRLMRENVETAGSLDASFSVAGTPAEPSASGTINGHDLQFALLDEGLLLSGGELVADFDRDRLRLSTLRFVSPNRVKPRDDRVPFAALTASPGQFTAKGEIALESGKGAFEFAADRLPLLQREDRWLILSGAGKASSTWSSVDIDADFRADAGFIAIGDSPSPSLSDDVVVLGREAPEPGRFAVTARLGVALGDALYLTGMGVDTRLAGGLTLRLVPPAPLSAVGTISTVGGSYRGYGQRLSIERGLINFQGEVDNPGLNIVALRKGLEVEAGVAITGSARRPQVKLVSDPAVPDPEKLSWIVLGRAPDAGGGADLALLLPAAQALLGGDGSGMTAELSRSLGLDSFSIGQGELNSTSRSATSRVLGSGSRVSGGPTVAGQVLSVGKRLSSDLVLSFEQSLGGAESLVKLTYQLGRRVSVVARGGTDNAFDIYYTFSFR